MKTCTVCHAESCDEDVRHLDLYIIGSEGIDACVQCRAALSDAARHLMHVASKCRMQGYKAATAAAQNIGEVNP